MLLGLDILNPKKADPPRQIRFAKPSIKSIAIQASKPEGSHKSGIVLKMVIIPQLKAVFEIVSILDPTLKKTYEMVSIPCFTAVCGNV